MKQTFLLLAAIAAFHPASAQTWTRTSALRTFWSSVAISADGNRILAAGDGNAVFTSADFGTNWTFIHLPMGEWRGAASSADGTRLMVAGLNQSNGPGWIFRSADSGATWISNNIPPAKWQKLACSTNGLRIIALRENGVSYASTNGGLSWTSNSIAVGPYAIASSGDGSRFVSGRRNCV